MKKEKTQFEFAETIDGMDALSLESGEIQGLLDEFREIHGTSANIDDFLQFLLSRGRIDESAYRKANKLEVVDVKLGSIELRDLPKSEVVYEILGKLGQGGMGEIRAARDKHLDRRVALKFLRPDKVNDRVVNRFVLEAQVTAKLQHPNIIPVYSFHGEEDKRLSFGMKLVSGSDLQDLLDDARKAVAAGQQIEDFALEHRIELFLRVCDAIAYAHDKGVLHRDLKPANIMLGEFNEVYVMDWGLAKVDGAEDDDHLWEEQIERHDNLDEEMQTRVGAVIGTPLFMAPEQARGEANTLDARADLFSLGAILFELVTLRRMYSARNLKDLLVQVRAGDKLEVVPLDPDQYVGPELEAIIEKATALKPEDRYDSVQAFARDIRRWRDNFETAALPDSPVRKATRWMSRNRSITLGIVLTIVVLLSGVTIWSLYEQNSAIQQAKVKQAKLGKLSATATERAMALDAIGTSVVSAAEALSQSTNYLVQNGVELPEPIYSSKDYESPETAPPDFKRSDRYGMNVSLGNTTYKLAPGVEFETVESTLRKLVPLKRLFRGAMVRAARITEHPNDFEEYVKLVEERGLPVRWAYVGLESGVFVSYPGKGKYPDEYDPRQRPWYKFGAKLKRGAVCGVPYVDSQGQGTVLPCVAPIRTPKGEFLGVAGYELTYDYLLEHHMQPYGPVEKTYLVSTDDMRIVVSSDSKQEYSRGKLEDGLKRELFPNDLIRAKIGDGEAGQYEVVDPDGVARIYTLVNLPTRRSFYVEVAPLKMVMAQ